MRKIILLLAGIVLMLGCLDEEFPAYDASKNYCGPEGLFGVPNSNPLSGANFNSGCYNHDKCYAECKTNHKTQGDCDAAFKQSMDDACDAAFDQKMSECDLKSGWNPLKYTCIANARISASSCWTQSGTYWAGVSAGGKAVGSYPCKE